MLGCFFYCITTQFLTKNLRAPDDGLVFFPHEEAGDRGVEHWDQDGKPMAFLYVDDTTLFDAVGTDNAADHLSTSVAKATFEGLCLERDLAEMKRRVEGINMKINAKKTQPLVISPPNGYNTTAVLRQDGEEEVRSIDTLKLVGFTFGSKPGAAAHLEVIRSRFRRRVWMLYNLREAGFKGRTLYRLYCCSIRSIVEYCSVVYHHMLTAEQENALKKLQRLAVKICFGFRRSVEQTMEEESIKTLKTRRARRCDVFLKKAMTNPWFGRRWFPPRDVPRDGLRRPRQIRESRALTWRRFNSPLEALRRRANELGLAAPE